MRSFLLDGAKKKGRVICYMYVCRGEIVNVLLLLHGVHTISTSHADDKKYVLMEYVDRYAAKVIEF